MKAWWKLEFERNIFNTRKIFDAHRVKSTINAWKMEEEEEVWNVWCMHVKDLVLLGTYRFVQIAFDVLLEQTKNTKKTLKYKNLVQWWKLERTLVRKHK